ncbi:MAG: hypothetical protein QOD36_966 [Mycobacterium sp.]|jgi:hypothetical protein|nr:hypothetical protein [Mycobacterium sp.]MDT5243590.1 hypothetical protein [Mycobacterium sp.]MDT5330450.1 hypothetical protein [Mycobacterium sp.]
MTRLFAACLVAAVAVLVAAPQAAADPEDHVPYCSADQTPMDNNCRPMSGQVFTEDGTGANPHLPSGLDPGNEPVT